MRTQQGSYKKKISLANFILSYSTFDPVSHRSYHVLQALFFDSSAQCTKEEEVATHEHKAATNFPLGFTSNSTPTGTEEEDEKVDCRPHAYSS